MVNKKIFLLLGLVLLLSFTSAAWFDSEWDYKREIEITETSGSSLTNYSINLNISYDSDMQTDFDDLRFLNSAEDTELGYWIEEKSDGNWASIWVKVPSLTASSDTSIYMYYGNSGASSNSNGDNAFLFFDDFSGTTLNLSKWDLDETSSISGGELSAGRLHTDEQFGLNVQTSLKLKYSSSGWNNAGYTDTVNCGSTPYQNCDNVALLYWASTVLNPSIRNTNDGSDSDSSSYSNTFPTNRWKELNIIRTSTTTIINFDGETKSHSANFPTDNLYFGMYLKGGTVDIVKSRNYASSEPTYTVGSEETDVTGPEVTLNSPENNSWDLDGDIDFNATVTDELQVDNVSLYIDDTLNETNSSGVNGTYIFNKNLAEGSYTWKIVACNNNSLCTNSSTYNLNVDLYDPEVTIDYPENTTYTEKPVSLNSTVSDTNLDTCWYSLDEFTTNTSFTCNTDITGIEADEGVNTWYVCADDSAERETCESVTFAVDTSAPELNITFPIQDEYYNSSFNHSLEYNVSDLNLNECWYSTDNGTTNSTKGTCDGSFDMTAETTEGLNEWTVYADDTYGNLNSSYVSFTYDTISPVIEAELNETTLYAEGDVVQMSYNITDDNIEDCWYNYDGVNNTITCGTSQTTEITTTLSDLDIVIYANDSSSNLASYQLNMTIDAVPPVVNISYPENTTYTSKPTSLNSTASDDNLNNCTYSLDGFATNTTFTCNTDITGIEAEEGTNEWGVCAFDDVGNFQCEEVVFSVDSISPSLNITDPLNGSYKNESFDGLFEYDVSDTNLNQCWYSLDFGETNSTKESCTGSFDLSGDLSEGINNWTVYADDTFGNEESNTSVFTYDTTSPELEIIKPLNQTYATTDMDYTVQTNEPVESCVYSLDNFATNQTMDETNSTYFTYNEAISQGTYTVDFACQDFAENEGYNESTFTIQTVSTTLNEPEDGYIYYDFSPITFNSTGETVEGYVANMSLWTNQSGTWESSNTSSSDNVLTLTGQTITLGGNLTYDALYMDETSIIYVDSSIGYLNLTIRGEAQINGTINGDGRGYSGAPSRGCYDGDGLSGSGPGFGGGGGDFRGTDDYYNGGGGAGAYSNGGNGGKYSNRGSLGVGGSSYMVIPGIEGYIGSGGGGGAMLCGNVHDNSAGGGNGGAGIYITSKSIQLNGGTITSDGLNGGDGNEDNSAIAGGGGGSGGNIVLISNNLNLTGDLTTVGGRGGNGDNHFSDSCAQGGGGGSGGLISLFYKDNITDTTTKSYTGGSGGIAHGFGCVEVNGVGGGQGNESTSTVSSFSLPEDTQTETWNLSLTNDIIWNVQTCNSEGSCKFAPANYSVYIDKTLPEINITNPENTTYTEKPTELNYTVIDSGDNLDMCWYSDDFGETNSSAVTPGENFTITSVEGQNNYTVYCNDTVGNKNSDDISYFVDTIDPIVTIDFPLNDSKYNETSKVYSFNYTVDDTNPDVCWYSTDGGDTNSSTYPSGETFLIDSVLGENTWNVYCEDILGNFGQNETTFYIYDMNFTLQNGTENIFVEVGTPFDLFAEINLWNVSIDIPHTQYGINYLTGLLNVSDTINIDYFERDDFADGVYNYSLNGTGEENKTFDLEFHKYDYIEKFSFEINSSEIEDLKIFNPEDDSLYRFFKGIIQDNIYTLNYLFNINTNEFVENIEVLFDNLGSRFAYFAADDAIDVANISFTLSPEEYGFYVSDSDFEDTDEVLTNATVFLGSIMPARDNFTEEIFEDFNSSLNSSYWYLTPDYFLEDQFVEEIDNNVGGGKATLYLRLEEDIDYDTRERTVLTDTMYINDTEYFNLWSSEEVLFNLNYSLIANEYQSCGEATGQIRLYLGNTLVWESIELDNCDYTSNTYSDSLEFNITRDYENDQLLVDITGTEHSTQDTASVCNLAYVDRDWTNNKISVTFSDSDCAGLEYNETLPDPTLAGGFGNLDDQLKIIAEVDGDAESEVDAVVYSCSGDGYDEAYGSEIPDFEGKEDDQEYNYDCGTVDGMDNDDVQTYCEDALDLNGWDTGSCTLNQDIQDTFWGMEEIYLTANVYPINRTVGDVLDSQYVSESLFDSAVDITNVIGYVYGKGGINPQVSTDDGENWQEFLPNGVNMPIFYPGKHLKFKALFFNETNPVFVPIITNIVLEVEESYPENVSIDIGDDGVIDYNYSGEMTTDQNVSVENLNFSEMLTNTSLLAEKMKSVPIEVVSKSAGLINITDFELSYPIEDIEIESSLLRDFLSTVEDGIIPLKIGANFTNGDLLITNPLIHYLGGNYTLPITAHSEDYVINDTLNVTYYFSQWDYEFVPEDIDYVLFTPEEPTDQDVEPYGQDEDNPILNFTNIGYGSPDANLSISLNETLSCVNTTLSFSNNKSEGFILNESWIDLGEIDYEETKEIWLFADYDCDYSNYYHYIPYIYFRQCQPDSYCTEELI